MLSSKYRNLADKPYESHYLYEETVISHPVQKIWPHALNIAGWMSDYRLETLDGEPGKVGYFQRVHPPGISEQTPLPHYHLYGIAHLIPSKLIALEVLAEKGGSYGKSDQKMSFDSILLTELGSETRVGFLVIDAMMGEDRSRSLQDLQTKEQPTRDRLQRYFDNLRQLVDRDGR